MGDKAVNCRLITLKHSVDHNLHGTERSLNFSIDFNEFLLWRINE